MSLLIFISKYRIPLLINFRRICFPDSLVPELSFFHSSTSTKKRELKIRNFAIIKNFKIVHCCSGVDATGVVTIIVGKVINCDGAF